MNGTTTPSRTALVTGAAGVLGRGTVEKLLEDGRRVIGVDLDEAALKAAAEAFPADRFLPLALNVRDAQAPAQAREAVRQRGWPEVPILVNNAAISPRKDGVAAGLLTVTPQEWTETFDLNVSAQLRWAQAMVPPMLAQRWGRIVNISSRAGRSNVNKSSISYVTSKAAVLGLTRAIASEFAHEGITCNSVAPGLMLSPMAGTMGAEWLQTVVQRTAMRRAGSGREVGAVVAFLASEDAGFVTGACFDANGGQLMV